MSSHDLSKISENKMPGRSDMQKFTNPITQELFEIMNCFESNKVTKTRLVGEEEGVLLLMIKGNDIHSISDARLNEKQIISMLNYLSIFQVKLTQYSTRFMNMG